MIGKAKKALVAALEFLLVVAVAALVVDVVWGVFSRYALGAQTKWTEELARFLLVWVAMLGSAVAFGRKAHLGVDYLVEKFEPAVRKWATALAHVVVLVFAIVIFVYGGSVVVKDALQLEQMTPALGWKMGYVYSVLPLSGFFMVLFALDNLVESLRGAAGTVGEASSEAGGID